VRIHSNLKDYEVNFFNDFNFLKGFDKESTLFVVDSNVMSLYSDVMDSLNSQRIIPFEALEQNKTIQKALEICDPFIQLPSKRNSVIVSIGGGITQDVTGFVANILYRGIRWVYVPTTLLAQCDSCIGSKTSLNYQGYKNLLGTFYPPDEIYIVTSFLQTLSQKDFCSGLGELIKFACMQGDEGIVAIESSLQALLDRDSKTLNSCISDALLFKKGFIEEDEFDQGKRVLLNFAHTFGHALENVSCYEIPHGIAVALGMLMANRISLHRGLLKESNQLRIESLVRKLIKASEIELATYPIEGFLSAMRKDKKQTNDSLRAILLLDEGLLLEVKDITYWEVEDALVSLRDLHALD
jgi:3-dehydroquinate synthase